MTKWILTRNGKWHAWPHGGQTTLCGTINLHTIRTHPARQVSRTIPEEDPRFPICQRCRSKVGIPKAQLASGSPQNRWMGHLRAHTRRIHVRVSERDLGVLGTLLDEIGPPGTPEGQEIFRAVRILLLSPVRSQTAGGRSVTRLPRLRSTLDLLSQRPGSLRHVATAFLVWERLSPQSGPGHFKPDQVATVMLALSTAGVEVYVQRVVSGGITALGAVFHPNTLDRAKRTGAIRGIFRGTETYWNQTRDQLRIVSDE